MKLPGGVGVSHLRVYDTEGPDGLAGGTPHLHTVCAEAYLVAAGSGAVQTLTPTAGFAETPLSPGMLVTFGPGTVHRLVNGGELELFVVMGNAGLPEAGDMVVTLPDEVLADPDAYASAAEVSTPEEARRRRDLGVEGFLALKEGGGPALARFQQRAVDLVRDRAGGWRAVWENGPAAATAEAEAFLGAVAAGDAGHLTRAAVEGAALGDVPERRLGCCGTLGVPIP